MSRADPRTASPKTSIWYEIPEDSFREHIVALERRTNAVPVDPQAFVIEEWSSTCHDIADWPHTLPVTVEQQLADDFACLSAVEEGAQSVAAVCVEEHVGEPGLTLRFAALDISLNGAVRAALQDISRILARTASDVITDDGSGVSHDDDKDISLILARAVSGATTDTSKSQNCVDDLFNRVVDLHFRRLIARLRSVRWEKPKHLINSHKKPLWQDFANLIHRLQFVYSKQEKVLKQLIEKDLRELATLYRHFEEAQLDDPLDSMKRLVRMTFKLCSRDEIRDYVKRLEMSVGTKITSQVAAAIKTIRQLQKIGAHRRICLSLVKTAKQYPSLFKTGFSIAYLTPYNSIPTSIGYEQWATTCHVHAEVQLAVHYDLSVQNQTLPTTCHQPRCIGISKWLCYLCYQFLRAHGDYFPSKTHGRLYDQWTIPDLQEFEPDMVDRYRDVLKAMDEDIVSKTLNEPELWRVEPMTSIDLPSYLHSR